MFNKMRMNRYALPSTFLLAVRKGHRNYESLGNRLVEPHRRTEWNTGYRSADIVGHFEYLTIDPLSLLLPTGVLLLCALVASALPARRAASIEPLEALRTE